MTMPFFQVGDLRGIAGVLQVSRGQWNDRGAVAPNHCDIGDRSFDR